MGGMDGSTAAQLAEPVATPPPLLPPHTSQVSALRASDRSRTPRSRGRPQQQTDVSEANRIARRTVNLVLDDRESALAAALDGLTVPYTRERLAVGDAVVRSGVDVMDVVDGVDEVGISDLLVAERKTLQDLWASNVDGRYREQRARLAALGPEVAILYILEGEFSSSSSSASRANNHHQSLRPIISRLVLRYGFPVLHSSSVQETAQWLRTLLSQLEADAGAFRRTAPDLSMCALSSSRRGNHTALGMATSMLASVRGIGEGSAAELLRRHSLADLARMTDVELANLQVAMDGGAGEGRRRTRRRRLGPSAGRQLYDALRATTTQTQTQTQTGGCGGELGEEEGVEEIAEKAATTTPAAAPLTG